MTTITMNQVSKFLLGEAPLDGAWFGDKHPSKRGAFWWREHLRTALAATPSGPAWHDAPTVPGLWVDGINLRVLRFNDPDIGHIGKGRWLGPLPEDTK